MAVVSIIVTGQSVQLPTSQPSVGKPPRRKIVSSTFPTLVVILVNPPKANTQAVSLTDVDRDGDLDAIIGNASTSGSRQSNPNEVWLNDGNGVFSQSQTLLALGNTSSVVLAT